MDAVALENQKLPHVGLHLEKLKKMYEHNVSEPHYGKENERATGRPWMLPAYVDELRRDADAKEDLRKVLFC